MLENLGSMDRIEIKLKMNIFLLKQYKMSFFLINLNLILLINSYTIIILGSTIVFSFVYI